MTKKNKCQGCGITLQSDNKSNVGYTPDINNKLCERCFKLKHYNILTNQGIIIDNNNLLSKINKKNIFTLYLVDFLNIDKETMDIYNNITNKKVLLITKRDIIPKNIKEDILIDNIKKVYNIKENIYLISNKSNINKQSIIKIMKQERVVLFTGFTNMGKSSLINNLIGSDITVSKNSNTTQDFIKLKLDNITIYDTPGFISKYNRDLSIIKDTIKPFTCRLDSNYYLNILDINIYSKKNNNITIYIDNSVSIRTRKKKVEVSYDVYIPAFSDVIVMGIGFIRFKDSTYININTLDYEIRTSIIGGHHE